MEIYSHVSKSKIYMEVGGIEDLCPFPHVLIYNIFYLDVHLYPLNGKTVNKLFS